MAHPLLGKVIRAGKEQGWIDSREKLVAAVSGGGDSVAMLLALEEIYPGPILVAHLEHGMRDITSREDARFVAGLCERKGLQSFFRSLPVPSMRRRGESLEEAGRRLRYDFLEEVLAINGAAWIAVGHNSDDVVETMLINLLRGTGLPGLCGLPGKRGNIVRPLVYCSRSELRDYLDAREQGWREDETNEDTRYLRNRIRNELIPFLSRDYGSSFRERMLSLRENLLPLKVFSEGRGQVNSGLLRRNLPLALSAWDLKTLRKLERFERAEVFRSDAARLGLGALDQRKMHKLLDLVDGGQGWRFQWESALEIRCGGGYAALVDRDVLDAESPLSLALDGNMGSLRWGPGKFVWEKAGSAFPAFTDFSALVPVSAQSPFIEPAGRASSIEKGPALPWFYRKCWPTVLFGDKMSWTPFWGRKRKTFETPCSCLRITYCPDQHTGVA